MAEQQVVGARQCYGLDVFSSSPQRVETLFTQRHRNAPIAVTEEPESWHLGRCQERHWVESAWRRPGCCAVSSLDSGVVVGSTPTVTGYFTERAFFVRGGYRTRQKRKAKHARLKRRGNGNGPTALTDADQADTSGVDARL